MSTVPANPVDVEHAALDLLVNVPELAAETDHFRTALQDFAGLLQLESAFVGLGWADARRAAVMVCRLALFEDDPVAALRVAAVLAGVKSRPGTTGPRPRAPSASLPPFWKRCERGSLLALCSSPPQMCIAHYTNGFRALPSVATGVYRGRQAAAPGCSGPLAAGWITTAWHWTTRRLPSGRPWHWAREPNS
ncbi:hypothetical protein KN248_012165 [Mycobacterium paraintracellulare]|uniref:hypothetical protein n=1 Tax=Mycobacterium paraintracellulare TaxID=1138383 RepID=UPI001EED6B84|nr:hypothetical protein [Mycobacterium paraintracellulare]WVL46121.1 hypothetical protein KN248_012165 [Mycobacterium paraintracellulare]